MAKKIVQPVEVQASVKGDSSVKSFKAQIREAQQEALRLAAAFGETDARTLAAAQRVAELKDRMDDVNATIAGMHPDKFQAIANITGTLARGFQAAQGAAALLGGESQDLQKAMLKVQGAMAFADGVAGLKDIKFQLAGLKGIIIDSVVPAFTTAAGAAKMLRNALGIGLIISAVTALIAIFNKLDFSIDGVSKTDKKLLDQQKAKLKAAQDNVESLDAQDNILKAQGKSENDILRLKIAALKVAIDNQKAVIETSKAQAKSQIAAAQRNKDILVGILNFISAPMRLLLQTIDSVAEKLGYETGLLKNFDAATNSIAEMAFDPKETKKKADEDQKEMEKALLEMRNTMAGHELAIKENDKAARDERKKQAEDEAAKAKQRVQDAIDRDIALTQIEKDSLENRRKIAELEFQKRVDDLKKQGFTEEQIAKLKAAALTKVDEDFNKQQEEIRKANDATLKAQQEKALKDELDFINAKYDEQEIAALKAAKTQEEADKALEAIRLQRQQNQIQALKDAGKSTLEIEKQIEADRIKNAEDAAAKQKEIDKAVADTKKQAYSDVMTASSALIELIGQQTVAGKAIALAQIAADTGVAISRALAVTQSGSTDNLATGGLAGIAKFAAISAAILSASARAVKIVKGGNPQQGGNAGGSINLAGAQRPQLQAQSSLGGGTQFAGQTDMKVYVTEADITATQRRIRQNRGVSVI